jgi:hypothetical protein
MDGWPPLGAVWPGPAPFAGSGGGYDASRPAPRPLARIYPAGTQPLSWRSPLLWVPDLYAFCAKGSAARISIPTQVPLRKSVVLIVANKARPGNPSVVGATGQNQKGKRPPGRCKNVHTATLAENNANDAPQQEKVAFL